MTVDALPDLTTMSYHDLELLLGQLLEERHLATGTPRFAELAEQMQEIKQQMEIRNAEFCHPDRVANSQKIGFPRK